MAEEKEQDGKKKKSPLVLILVVVLLLAGSVGGTLYFMGFFNPPAEGDAGHEEAAGAQDGHHDGGHVELIYYTFEQPFTVNFQTESGLRFLQVNMDAAAQSQADIDGLIKHMPVVRNKLIFLLGNQTYEQLITRQGKEKLRQEILKAIQDVLEERTGSPGVEEVFFTSFVIQ